MPSKTLQIMNKLARNKVQHVGRQLAGIRSESQKEQALLDQYMTKIDTVSVDTDIPDILTPLPDYLRRIQLLAEQSRIRLDKLSAACDLAMDAMREAHTDKTRYQTLLDRAERLEQIEAALREQDHLDEISNISKNSRSGLRRRLP